MAHSCQAALLWRFTIVPSVDFDTPLVVYVEGDNFRELTRIKSWSIDSDYLTSTDGFEFVAVDDNLDVLRDLEAQPVRLTVGGATQLVGRIDDTSRGDDGLAVTCSGRDYIADLVECNIDPTLVVKEKETLGGVILKACAPIGITKIAPLSDVATMLDIRQGVPGKTRTHRNGSAGGNRTKEFKDINLEDLKPDIGQGIYEFLNPICMRHGCTIQPTHQRDTLLVAGPFYDQEAGFKIIRSRADVGTSNNIVSATVRRSYASFPTMVIVQGQGAPRSGETTAGTQETIDTWAEAQHFGGELARTLNSITWTGRRKPGTTEALPIDKIYRLNVFRDDKARNPDQISNAARRLFAEHLKKTLEYHVKIRGHIDPVTGALWTHDTIVSVNDDVCDVHEDLWVQSRRFTYNQNDGPFTELVCIRPGSFEI